MKKTELIGLLVVLTGCTGEILLTTKSVNEFSHACDNNGGIVEYSLFRTTGSRYHKVGGITCANGAKLSRSVAAAIHESAINVKHEVAPNE